MVRKRAPKIKKAADKWEGIAEGRTASFPPGGDMGDCPINEARACRDCPAGEMRATCKALYEDWSYSGDGPYAKTPKDHDVAIELYSFFLGLLPAEEF